MSGEIAIKRGASLRLQLMFAGPTGVPLDVSGMAIDGQVRTASDQYVAALPIAGTSQTGVALVTVADTSGWPVGLLRADLRCAAGGITVLTETFCIRVNRAVTR